MQSLLLSEQKKMTWHAGNLRAIKFKAYLNQLKT